MIQYDKVTPKNQRKIENYKNDNLLYIYTYIMRRR